MKEITYNYNSDYLKKTEAFVDAKVVKVWDYISSKSSGGRPQIKAVTFMRTWLFQYIGDDNQDFIQKLEAQGHCRGKIEEIVPLGRAI